MMSTFLGDGKERGSIWTSLALCPRPGPRGQRAGTAWSAGWPESLDAVISVSDPSPPPHTGKSQCNWHRTWVSAKALWLTDTN
jgi:hypothetical protein